MHAFHSKRIWFWIGVAAIAVAVIALLMPHAGNTADQHAFLALLPVYFAGLLTPLTLQPLRASLRIGHVPEAPALSPAFQRPPPSLA